MSYKPFPIAVFPDPFREFIELQAAGLSVDPCYVALPLLSASAAAVGSSRRIRINSEWSEPCMIWTVIVGDSSEGKSPSLTKATQFARRQEHEAAQRHHDELTTWKREVARIKAAGDKETPLPDEPIRDRYVVDDVTIEVIGELLEKHPRGLLLACDELSGWFNSFGLYKGGKGATGEAGKWCSMWSGAPISIDRKTATRKTIYVPNPAISVCGGIQPAILQKTLQQNFRECGLSARLLFAYPPKHIREYREAAIPSELMSQIGSAFDYLYGLEGELEIEMSPEAKERFKNYVNIIYGQQYEAESEVSAAFGKLVAYCARFALILHLLERSLNRETPAREISLETLEHAIDLSMWFLREMTRLYAMLDRTEKDQLLIRVLSRLKKKGPQRAKDLRSIFHRDFESTDEIRDYMAKQIDDGYVIQTSEGHYEVTDEGSGFLAV